MEIGQRLALGDDQEIEPAVVVEITNGKATAKARNLPGDTRQARYIAEPARRSAQEELRRHGKRDVGAQIVDMAVGRGQVEPPVVVGVKERGSEAQEVPAGGRQPDGSGAVDELTATQVLIERGRR